MVPSFQHSFVGPLPGVYFFIKLALGSSDDLLVDPMQTNWSQIEAFVLVRDVRLGL